MKNFGGLNRALDMKHWTNRLILVMASLAGALVGVQELLQGRDLIEVALAGFFSGAAVFFGWAICREVDPNSERSAFVAAGISWWLYLSTDGMSFLASLFLVLVLRMLNRISGQAPSILDLAMPVTIAFWLGLSGSWEYTLYIGLGFWLDSRLPAARRWTGLIGILIVCAALIGISRFGQLHVSIYTLPGLGLGLIIGILWLRFVKEYVITTHDDRGVQLLTQSRMRATQWFILVAIGLGFLLGGKEGVAEIGAGLAAILAAIIFPWLNKVAGKLSASLRGAA